jgi:hypothetical protein
LKVHGSRGCQNDDRHDAKPSISVKIRINRAPVLTLWACVVAEC